MSAAQLLKRLTSASRHSHAALASYFDVCDQELEQWFNELSSQGIAIWSDGEAVMLTSQIDWLELDRVEQHSDQPFSLELSLETESTSADLQCRAAHQSIHQLALTTEYQRAGRGRMGRSWQSPVAQNIALSVGWQFDRAATALEGLSLAIGASLARAVDDAFGVSLKLKWPNDLYLNDRKCGGVLVEVSGDLTQSCTVIVGVGLNLIITEQAGKAIDQPWAALGSELPSGVSRSAVLGVMLDSLSVVLQSYRVGEFEQWHALYAERDWLFGQHVVIEGAQTVRGLAAGINKKGALLVHSNGEQVPIFAGEAQLARRSSATPGELSDASMLRMEADNV
jgi:BirA family biotin operon repressor/biotin-[acetyl-CoA-carboxylase] ligase